ncbi:MAG: bifunctional diaminohydroxyphosphoribosylaminopyrimidine deaminase/5-amino-6-(5-phosphoribosylamino)uracil reductase RibD [Pseudomonadota bacterium]
MAILPGIDEIKQSLNDIVEGRTGPDSIPSDEPLLDVVQTQRMPSDAAYMGHALQLAKRGLFTAHPNPRVGCVLVKDSHIVGEGWHQRAGESHAEVVALKQAGRDAAGATAYVTLEPCCHHGQTPPCTKALVKAGIKRVVIATEDPNPQVNEGGIFELSEAGIDTSVGIGRDQARELNRGFIKRMQYGRPWVTLKIAVSLDGKTAMADGESQWITSEASRLDAHRMRAAASGILTGVGTVLRDNPALTARAADVERQPLRIIVDTHLSTPANARLLSQPGSTLILTSDEGAEDLNQTIFPSMKTVEVESVPRRNGRVDLAAMLEVLGRRQMNEIMLEAGASLSGAMLNAGLVDEIVVYQAPDLLGSATREMFALNDLATLSDKLVWEYHQVRMVGRDCKIILRSADAPGI